MAAGSGWGAWLRAQLQKRNWTAAELIRRSGDSFDSSRVTRWTRHGEQPSFEAVRSVCTALDVPVVEGLIAAGLLTLEDVGAENVRRAVSELNNDELLIELAQRLDRELARRLEQSAMGYPVVVDEPPEDVTDPPQRWAALSRSPRHPHERR